MDKHLQPDAAIKNDSRFGHALDLECMLTAPYECARFIFALKLLTRPMVLYQYSHHLAREVIDPKIGLSPLT
jgi:hypothetical protein